MKPYIYHPLQSGEIRLFEMDPSTGSDDVMGTLRTIILDAQDAALAAYTALSYAWGDTYPDGSHLTDYIVCDGLRLRVTPTLKQALVRIRHLSESKQCSVPVTGYEAMSSELSDLSILWIDAICIDQENLIERSEQVKMMASIYNLSSGLLIWLGELSPGRFGDEQFDVLDHTVIRRPGHVPVDRRLHSTPKVRAKRRSRFKLLFRQRDKDEKSCDSESISPLQVLNSILDRPWFRRRWVIQECEMAARDCTFVLMGEALCHRKKFEAILDRRYQLDRAPPLN